MMPNIRTLLPLLFLPGMFLPAFGATTNYSFTGVTSDGRTLTVQFSTANAVSAATTLTAGQVSCAPACDDIAILPNAAQRYDLLVFDVRTGGVPLTYQFFLPYGAFATPGSYSTLSQPGAFNSGTLTVQTVAQPAITTQSPLTNGVVGAAYSLALSASGGSGPYSFAIVDPANAPPGLSLATNGVLQGIPSAIGTYTFQVRITDTAAATTTRSFVLTVGAGVNITTSPSLPNGGLQLVYSQTLAAAGGTPGYTWAVTSGSLPPGLTLAPSGVISGVPTQGGSYSFTVRARDAASATATQTFTISIPSLVTIATTPQAYGAIGAPYQQTFTALGGNPPYTWSATSALPAGLSMSAAGVLSGTPTVSSNSLVTVRATDNTGNTANLTFTLSIVTGVTATTAATLPPAPLNAPYSFNFSAVGGNPPYNWTLAAGTLPPGLTLTSAGLLSGTPTAAANYTFTLVLRDATANLAVNNFNLVVGTGLNITTGTTLPTGATGTGYSQTLTATGGTAPLNWSVSGGSLPPGLTLATNGVLSGLPTAGGTYNFIVRLTDSAGSLAVQSFSLTIGTALTITSATPLPAGTAGTPYTFTMAATGGSAPYVWTVASGSVPTGLTLATNGVLSGTPTVPNVYPLTIRVTDNTFASVTKDFTLTIGSTGLGLTITTPSPLPSGSLQVPYSTTLTASGGVAPYSWSIVGGSIPPNLSLSTAGVLSGTPTTAGVYTLTARVTDASNTIATANLTITIASGLVITTTSVSNGVAGSPFSQQLTVAGGTPGYLWSFASGTLTPGLTISNSGLLSGTPSTAGTFQFTVRVQDATGAFTTQSLSQTVTSGITISTASQLPNAALGVLYNQPLTATGGVQPYNWSLDSGTLAPGLSISPTGAITGTPTTAGAYTFGIRANDSVGAITTKVFSLTVGSGITITTTTLPSGNVGTPYTVTFAASGGIAPYTWALISGSVPPGLTLNGSVLSGTPTTAGSYTLQVRVTDAASANATQTFTVTIGAGLTITTPGALPNATVNVAYSQTLAVSGGTAPYFWSLVGGTLPAGLSIGTTGTIQGTPTVAGPYTFQIRVQDSVGANFTQSFTLTVGTSNAITITTPSPLPNASLGTVYFQALAATGGTAPYTWTVASGTLPPGINLLTSGQLSGLPTAGGEYNFVIRATDAGQLSGTQSFKLTVSGGITITTPNPVPDGTVGINYSLTFTASGGVAPYTYAIFSGNAPSGLTLSTAGVLSGLPTTAGTYSFVLRVIDAAGQSNTQNITITINATAVAPRAGVITQLASGGGWKTTMVLLNLGTAPANVKVNFAQDDGTPLSLPFVVTQQGVSVTVVGNTVERSIPANTTLLIESEAPGTVTQVGWADVRSSSTISGYAIFRQRGGDGRDSEGTSPLENRVQSTVILPYDNTSGFITGIALSNLNSNSAVNITASIHDDTGAEIAIDTLQIPANGHTSFAVPSRLPSTAGKRGFVEFTSTNSSGLTGLGLRFSPTLSFTSIPVVIR